MPAYSVTHNEYVEVEAGFRVARTFARLHADYRDRYALTRDVYAMPRLDREPAQSRIQYRGLDRDPLNRTGHFRFEGRPKESIAVGPILV